VNAARQAFELDIPGKDGHTPRAHLEAAQKMTGKAPRRLTEAEVPSWGQYLLNLFWDLQSARGSTGWGPAAMSWADMTAWIQLRRLRLDAWEVDVLRRLDQAWLQAYSAKD